MTNLETTEKCEGYCCNECVECFYSLIELLIKDIQHLEAKIIFLRFSLSKHLPEYDGEMLRSDIFSDLARCHWDHPAYQEYMEEYNFGQDPMNDANQIRLMRKISLGEVSVNL
jgi:hypothetical protein